MIRMKKKAKSFIGIFSKFIDVLIPHETMGYDSEVS